MDDPKLQRILMVIRESVPTHAESRPADVLWARLQVLIKNNAPETLTRIMQHGGVERLLGASPPLIAVGSLAGCSGLSR